MRGGIYIGRGVLRSGRRRRCRSPLHVLDHGGLARLAHVARITDTATAAPVADDTTDATATDATPDATATASAAPASAVLCVHGGVAALRGVPLRHRQLLVLDDRQTFNLDIYDENYE